MFIKQTLRYDHWNAELGVWESRVCEIDALTPEASAELHAANHQAWLDGLEPDELAEYLALQACLACA